MYLASVFSKQKKLSYPPERILPFDVRYALQYREAKLGVTEISDLVQNGFECEALYLILKSAVSDPDLQLVLLQQTVESLICPDVDEVKTLKHFLYKALQILPSNTAVGGQKLAGLSRHGFTMWHQLYERRAVHYARSPKEVYLLGHATFVGLSSFVRSFARTKKDLHLLIPAYFTRGEKMCGYSISDGQVTVLLKDFKRMESVLIDDARHTGQSVREALLFWTDNGVHLSPEIDIMLENQSWSGI